MFESSFSLIHLSTDLVELFQPDEKDNIIYFRGLPTFLFTSCLHLNTNMSWYSFLYGDTTPRHINSFKTDITSILENHATTEVKNCVMLDSKLYTVLKYALIKLQKQPSKFRLIA